MKDKITNRERVLPLISGHLHAESGRNSTSPSTLDYADLIEKAREDIKLVSGGLPKNVFLSDAMTNAVEIVFKRNPGVKFQILVGPEADKESISFYRKKGAVIKILKHWPIDHFAIVDNRHIRVENPHPPGDPNCSQDIYFNYMYTPAYENLFDSLAIQTNHR